MSQTPLRIDVVSDVVCPWCFVGKRQLEMALERFAQANPQAQKPEVHWHPFQLNPQLPAGGMARSDYLAGKFGTADPGKIYDRVKEAGKQVNLELPIEGIVRQPNTAAAHALVAAVEHDVAMANTLQEALFEAYFVAHKDFTSLDVLRDIALQAGLNDAQIAQAFSDEALAAVRSRDAQVREQGVSGVPLFVINQRKALNGAVGADALLEVMQDLS